MALRMPYPGITCTTSFLRFQRHGVNRSMFLQHWWHCWGSDNRTGHHRPGHNSSGTLCSGAVSRHSAKLQSGDPTFSGVLQGGTSSLPVPAMETKLAQFVAKLYRKKLSSSTLENDLAAVCHSQIAMGLRDPQIGSMPRLGYAIKGMKRNSAT